jgi:hypothetical protein
VAKLLQINRTHHSTVKKVIDDYNDFLCYRETYSPERHEHMRPDKWKICLHRKEISVLTALKEMGGSNRNVLALLNMLYQLPKGLPPLGYRALWGAVQRSNFLLSKTKLQHQASNNRPAWVQARFNACYQLAVRFSLDIPTDTNNAKVTCLPAVDKERIK